MRFAKIARIQDFMPDSVDWDKYIARGYAERVRDDIADAENEAMQYIAKKHAKRIKKEGISDEQQMVAQANRDLGSTVISTAGQIALAGAQAGWFSGGGAGNAVNYDVTSLTPGVDVRTDFSNTINPIPGFGGVAIG